ncbi:MAG: hypothetical protein EBV03_10995 [Proteobacteria bacterium]|nr:hypothetical protein [Pseudomonadota bacterium]
MVLPPNLKPTSLFIQPAEQAQINEAVAAYKRARENANKNAENQAKNFLNQLEELPQQAAAEPPKPVPFTYPQFFLELLNYRGPNDWLVQINGRKFAPHIFPGEHWLKIIMVDRDSVVVEWTPKDMDKVTDAWMVVPMNDVSRSDVLVDSVRDTVTFTLRPNQTFSSYAMRVLEGKVKPVTVMVLNGETVSAAPAPGPGNTASGTATVAVPPTASPTAQAAPPATEEKKEGVKALDDTYKKLGID